MLLGGTVAAASPAFASHVEREVVPVATGAGGQFDPSIKGDSIAYTDTSIAGNGADIVVYRISDGSRIRIDNGGMGGGAQEVEDIDGDFVVFRSWAVGDSEGEIVVYQISTGDATQQRCPPISGKPIVWTDVATSKIWVANVDGTGAHQLDPTATAFQFQSAPAISGKTVVFVENGAIIAYDITTNTRTTIAASGSDPDISGSKIVWEAGGDIWLKDGAAAAVNLTNDAAIQRRPKVSSTLVAFEQVVSGTDVD